MIATRAALITFATLLLSCSLMHAQGTWSTESSDGFSPRAGLVTVVVDGKIYAIAGANEGSYAGLSTLEVFDPSSNTWSTPTTTGTFTPRFGPAAVVLGKKIFVLGGT